MGVRFLMSTDYLRSRLDNLEHKIAAKDAKKARFAEFQDIDTVFVGSLTDKDLASWQSQHPTDSTQHILANHEWQRRLNSEQIKSNDKTARMGILGVVLGSVITFAASNLPNIGVLEKAGGVADTPSKQNTVRPNTIVTEVENLPDKLNKQNAPPKPNKSLKQDK